MWAKTVGRAGGGVAALASGNGLIGLAAGTSLGAGVTSIAAAIVPARAISVVGNGLAGLGLLASARSAYQHVQSGAYDRLAEDLTGLLGSGIVRQRGQQFAKTVATEQAKVVAPKLKTPSFTDELGNSMGAARPRYRILQSGERTIRPSTADALNENLEKSLSRRDWGRAVERLKRSENLRNDYHGPIDQWGNYYDVDGNILGNLEDYL